MIRFFLTFVIFLLIAVQSSATEPVKPQIEPALIRGDGMLVDPKGVIIGVRNIGDERATPYKFYYFGVTEDNEPTEDSVFTVYQNPNATKQDYVMEKIIPDVIDDRKIVAISANAPNVIFTENKRMYFNGKKIESGSVINAGIVTLIKGKLRYNGKAIQSGTMVKRGVIIPEGQVTYK